MNPRQLRDRVDLYSRTPDLPPEEETRGAVLPYLLLIEELREEAKSLRSEVRRLETSVVAQARLAYEARVRKGYQGKAGMGGGRRRSGRHDPAD